MHRSSRIISTSLTTLGWFNSVHRAISRTADCESPVYWIVSPSLSGLNLELFFFVSISLIDDEEVLYFLIANSPFCPFLPTAL